MTTTCETPKKYIELKPVLPKISKKRKQPSEFIGLPRSLKSIRVTNHDKNSDDFFVLTVPETHDSSSCPPSLGIEGSLTKRSAQIPFALHELGLQHSSRHQMVQDSLRSNAANRGGFKLPMRPRKVSPDAHDDLFMPSRAQDEYAPVQDLENLFLPDCF